MAESIEIFVDRHLSANVSSSTNNSTVVPVSPNDSEVLRTTLRTYGIFFLIAFILFCTIRKRFPRVYNVRSWVTDLHCKLCDETYGHVSWLWHLWFISDDDFRECCGMDALAFTRIMRFGLQIALIGMFNSLWLLPTYATAAESPETYHIKDPIAILSVAHVPPGSSRLLGLVLASYITFGSVMYLLLKEFEWFTEHRHKFLSETAPRNYTLYVSHIPPEYRSSARLLDYFRNCFSHDAVLEAHVALKIPGLEQRVADRERIVHKLEHAINIETIKGKRPKHRTRAKKMDSIDVYSEKLRALNTEIRDSIHGIEKRNNTRSFQQDLEAERGTPSLNTTPNSHLLGAEYQQQSKSQLSQLSESYDDMMMFDKTPYGDVIYEQFVGAEITLDQERPLGSSDDGRSPRTVASSAFSFAKKSIASAGSLATKTAAGALRIAAVEAQSREAGFVSFTRLSTTQAALQMIHHPKPFFMNVAEAPDRT